MNLIDNTSKSIALNEEVDTAIILIKKGLIEIQNMNTMKTQSCKHIPLLLLSNGFERLLKCILIFDYYRKNNMFPTNNENYFKNFHNGHGLFSMLQEVIKIAKNSETMMTIPLSRNEIEFLESDNDVKDLFNIFSNYARFGRYYYLDVITKPNYPKDDNPVFQFEKFRDNLYIRLKYPVNDFWENIVEFNKQNIFILAKITRAICRCFTHGDFGYIATMHYAEISDFTNCLNDNDLMQMKYLKL